MDAYILVVFGLKREKKDKRYLVYFYPLSVTHSGHVGAQKCFMEKKNR